MSTPPNRFLPANGYLIGRTAPPAPLPVELEEGLVGATTTVLDMASDAARANAAFLSGKVG